MMHLNFIYIFVEDIFRKTTMPCLKRRTVTYGTTLVDIVSQYVLFSNLIKKTNFEINFNFLNF